MIDLFILSNNLPVINLYRILLQIIIIPIFQQRYFMLRYVMLNETKNLTTAIKHYTL